MELITGTGLADGGALGFVHGIAAPLPKSGRSYKAAAAQIVNVNMCYYRQTASGEVRSKQHFRFGSHWEGEERGNA